MNNKLMMFLTMGSIFFVNGCSTYFHSIHNATDKPIHWVNVYYGNNTFGHGTIMPKSQSGYSCDVKFSKSTPPEVEWRLEDNSMHRQAVPLSRNPGTKYETHFVVTDEGVKAFFLSRKHTSKEYQEFLASIGDTTSSNKSLKIKYQKE